MPEEFRTARTVMAMQDSKLTSTHQMLRGLPVGRKLGLVALSLLIGLAVAGTGDAVWSFTWGSGWGDRPEVRFDRVFTNDDGKVDSSARDPFDDGTDPGYDKPVARCEAWKADLVTVEVRIDNGYPSYTCQTWVKIRNTGEQAVRSASFSIEAPPYLRVMRQGTANDLILWPGEWAYQSFTVHVEQGAAENERYELALSYTFVQKYYKGYEWKNS